MNFFRSIFNQFAAPAVPQAMAISPITGEIGPTNAAPRAQADDGRTADEAHFGTPLYVPGIGWRRGRPFFHNPQGVPRELLLSVVREAGRLFSDDDEKQIATIQKQIARVDEQFGENDYSRVRVLLPAHFQAQIAAAIANGQQPPPVPSFEERLAQLKPIREALHARKKELTAQAFAILKPGLQRFTKAAWKAAKAQDAEERGGLLHRWRLQFEPSPMLRGLAYLALRSADPLRWFEETGQCNPSTDPKQIWAHVLQTQPVTLPPGTTMQEVRQMQRDQAEDRRNRELDAEKAAHKKRVAALNEFNDRIRSQDPGAPPHLPGYRARAANPSPEPTAPAPATQPPAPETPEAEAPPAKL